MATGASQDGVHRRSFLKGVTAAGAAAVGSTLVTSAAAPVEALTTPREAPRSVSPVPANASLIERPGSDFMVDVLKALNVEYVASNPGSSFRSLQESIVNYGNNTMPEFLTAMHEES